VDPIRTVQLTKIKHAEKESNFQAYIILTPLPRIWMTGITFSLAMDCRTRGVPYIAAKQLDIEETYRPARRRKPAHILPFWLAETSYTILAFNLEHPPNQLHQFQFTEFS
jgi:hypothetical protein